MRSAAEFHLDAPGDAWFSEGGATGPTYLDHEPIEEVKIQVGYDAGTDLREEDGYFIDLQFFHAVPKDGGPTYSGSVEVLLSLEQVRLLHQFLGFLIANPQDFAEALPR